MAIELATKRIIKHKLPVESKLSHQVLFLREMDKLEKAGTLDYQQCMQTAREMKELMDWKAAYSWAMKALKHTDNGEATETIGFAANQLYLLSFDSSKHIKGKIRNFLAPASYSRWRRALFRGGSYAMLAGELAESVGKTADALKYYRRASDLLWTAKDRYEGGIPNEKMAVTAKEKYKECERRIERLKKQLGHPAQAVASGAQSSPADLQVHEPVVFG